MKRTIWLILALALFLRLWGVEYGFPNFLISDERALVFGALKMIELRTLVPAFYPEEFRPLYYMPFMSYVFLIWLLPFLAVKYALAGFPGLAEFKAGLLLDPSSIWIWSRALVAILGTINVYVVYLISKKIFNSERAALFSALFVALSFYHIQLSHMTRHWMPAITFTYLAWLAILYIWKDERLKHYVWGAFAAGAAFVTNPSSIAVFLPLGIIQIARKKIFSKNIFIFFGLFAVCSLLFIMLHPFGVTFAEPTKGGLDPIGNLLWRLTHIFNGGVAGWMGLFIVYAKVLLKYETALFVLALVGFWLAYKQNINRLIIFSALMFVVGYVTAINFMLITFARPVIVLIPLFAVFAGYTADWAVIRFSRLKIFCWIIIFLIFGYSFLVAMKYDYLMSKKDNRLIAVEWISQNIPAGSKILAELPYMRLPNSKKGISDMQKIDSGSLRSADFALLSLPDDKYPQPGFDVLNLHFISAESQYRNVNDARFFKEKGYKYLVVEYAKSDLGDLDEQSKSFAEQAKLIKGFTGTYDLRDEISGIWPWEIFKYHYFGPNIDVYEL